MRRLVPLLLVPVLLFAVRPASADSAENETLEAIKARIQEALTAAAAKPRPKVLVLPIREEIDASTAVYVEREMERAAAEKVDVVLVDMNTPGGMGDAMLRICNAFLQQDVAPEKRIPVVAWVNRDAYSAGAIICMSCGRIYMAPGGKIGAATGYVLDPQTGLPAKLPESVEAKFLSAEVAEVQVLAKLAGYPPGIVTAMVDPTARLVEYKIDGRRELLTELEFQNLKLRLKLGGLSPAEYAGRVEVVRTFPEDRPLTLTYEEAEEIGLSTKTIGSQPEVLKELGLESAELRVAEHNWSEFLFGFLASPGVRGILLLLGLGGLYLEFKAPGFGLPGILGVLCLALFFFSQYFMGLANYTGLLVFLLGLALLLIELFLIPGFGVTGIVGIFLMVLGLFLGMQPWVVPDVHNPFDMQLFMTNILVMSVVLIAVAAFAVVVAKVLPSVPLLGRIILTSTGPAGELRASGTVEAEEASLVGTRGTALSRLRPAGRAEFGGKILDVVTEGGFLEAGTPLVVSRVEGNRVVVRNVE